MFFIAALFIGFNHHRQLCVFGSALLFNETQESFKWLLNTFLKCMDGKAPTVIYSDEDLAIAGAVRTVMPSTQHFLCSWHLDQNAKKNLSAIYSKPGYVCKIYI